ncbi:MAG TPA: hypothetical protein VIQ30_01045 [Pseudonocardia sp.]
MTTPARQELHNLIKDRIVRAQQRDNDPERLAAAVMALVHEVTDDWEHIDISTLGEEPGSHFLDQRWLMVRVPRESQHRRLPTPDRTVAP